MEPMTMLAIGTAIAGAAGGIAQGRASKKDRKEDRLMQKYQFDQLTRHAIRNRVMDARAAGIHPLAAIGAGMSGSPTISSARPTEAGGAMQAVSQVGIEAMRAQSEKDIAEAYLAASKAAKIESDLGSQGRDAATTYPYGVKPEEVAAWSEVYGLPKQAFGGAEYVPPMRNRMQAPGVESGTAATHIEVMDPSGRKFRILNKEIFEELSSPPTIDYISQRASSDLRRKLEKAGAIVNMQRDESHRERRLRRARLDRWLRTDGKRYAKELARLIAEANNWFKRR